MALELTPEVGIEIPPNSTYMDLRERAEAACNTATFLEGYGLNVTPTDTDKATAAVMAESYAVDPEKTSKKVSSARTTTLTPASLIQTGAILKEFGQLVATRAAEIRHTVVNKLILETENPDARVRLRALENLGKIAEVGLFTERKEITVTHQNAADLRAKLKEKLEVLKQDAEGVYEVVEDGDN